MPFDDLPPKRSEGALPLRKAKAERFSHAFRRPAAETK